MKICLVGKNLTNYVLAAALNKANLSISIIFNENKKKISERTLAISNSNLDYLNKILNHEKLPVWPSKIIKIFSEKSISSELYKFENKNQKILNLIKYQDLLSFFYNQIKKKKNIKLKKINNKFNFDKLALDFDLIINSEKANKLSKKFFYKKIKKNYSSIAYTCIGEHQNIKNFTAIQIFTKYGPLAFLPYKNNKTSIVFSCNSKINYSDKKIIDLISKYNLKYKFRKFSNLEKAKLDLSLLRNYYLGNFLAFGDLLHQVHPLAGQGFNMTIRDIKILCDLIEERVNLGLDIKYYVPKQFELKIRSLNYLYANSIDFIYEFFRFDSKLDNYISNPIFKFLRKSSFLNKYSIKLSNFGF